MSETQTAAEKRHRLTINQLLSPIMALIAAAVEPYNEDANRKRLLKMGALGAFEIPEDSTLEAEVEKMIGRQKAKLTGNTFEPSPEQVAFVGNTVRDFFKKEERVRVSLPDALLPVCDKDDETIYAVVKSYTEEQKKKLVEAQAKAAAAKK